MHELYEPAKSCSLSDTGNWTNQNVVFTKALLDMFPLALTILKGALQRDECRGAHYKPAFAFPSLKATEPAERRREAEEWCDRFEANNAKWLKSTIAQWTGDDVEMTYEDVDTSLIPPRPRLYGLVGAEDIEKVWKERAAPKGGRRRTATAAVGVGQRKLATMGALSCCNLKSGILKSEIAMTATHDDATHHNGHGETENGHGCPLRPRSRSASSARTAPARRATGSGTRSPMSRR